MTYYVTGMFLHLSFGRFYWLMLAVAGAAAIITLRETATRPPPNRRRSRGSGPVHAQRPINQSV